MKKLIVLSTKKELEIYMNPNRQEIIRELGRAGKPVTPKYLADKLNISPSSVQFHLKKLETLGVVFLHHTEQIRGITARFYAPADVDVSIEGHLEEFRQEREILLQNMIHNVFQGCCQALSALPREAPDTPDASVPADILTGIAFLTESEVKELRKTVFDFLISHNNKRPDSHPWEYSLLAYKMEENSDK